MEYNHKEIETRRQQLWKEAEIYRCEIDKSKPKFYVLDMFPYPSGAGLHVGHPLGYIASDIVSRFYRQKGYNVLHPMGYDAYGLPAEQYAIQTGCPPQETTSKNIARYRMQLDKIGFSYDWNRELRTCDPEYYKWTQWAFGKMFESYYDTELDKARPISELIEKFEKSGTEDIHAASTKDLTFTSDEWKNMDAKAKSDVLMNYRIAFQANTMVNWCPKLGTVLANDEVSEGVSVRGGYPVEQKMMYQWCLRVSAYADRLLKGLEKLKWSDALKETQRNWIGKSEGAEIQFKVAGKDYLSLTVFTTRADTVFGVTFMVLAPESKYVDAVVTREQKEKVAAYLDEVKHKTERERMIEKKVTGVFTGSYAINPLSGKEIPIYVSDYVLAGYGTGAIMAVPAHDQRDYVFAKKFNLPIIPLIEGCDVSEESFEAKEGKMINSCGPDLDLNGLEVKDAIAAAKKFVEESGIGRIKTNFRLRDAIFSRQRYWGEPFPIYYKDGVPVLLNEDKLPLLLPKIDKYLPTETGEPPLGRAKNWKTEEDYPLELNTMPGFAGSSAYYFRYMDPHNPEALVSKEANDYWQNVDLYIGGTEHATGHLIYSRFWNKFLYDLGYVCLDEPFKKLVNQGMIQGRSNFVYRIKDTDTYVSAGLKDNYETTPLRVDINLVDYSTLELDTEGFKKWRPDNANARFILEDGKYYCTAAVEKMSKSMFNVVNPDEIVDRYGADTLRLYEMFLGPLEQSKPWDTNGIDGVNRFIKKLWGLYYNGDTCLVDDSKPTSENLRSINKLIKKVTEDISNFSFNTSVAAFMICVNELSKQKCHSREVLDKLLRVLAPFAPHIADELYDKAIGGKGFIINASWPEVDESALQENSAKYAVSFNGKMRFTLELPADTQAEEVKKIVLSNENTPKWLGDKEVKKVIVVPKKIVNIVF